MLFVFSGWTQTGGNGWMISAVFVLWIQERFWSEHVISEAGGGVVRVEGDKAEAPEEPESSS